MGEPEGKVQGSSLTRSKLLTFLFREGKTPHWCCQTLAIPCPHEGELGILGSQLLSAEHGCHSNPCPGDWSWSLAPVLPV
jgi:hypothetical protein